MEPRSQDQLAHAQYHEYQPLQSFRSDWATTAPPQTAQHPIESLYQVPDHRRTLQAPARSAQGFHKAGYPSSTNSDILGAENIRTFDASRLDIPATPAVAQQTNLALTPSQSLSKFSPQGLQGNNDQAAHLQHQKVPNYAFVRHRDKPQYHHSRSLLHFPSLIPNFFDDSNLAMSLSYESRQYMTDASYPQMPLHEAQEQDEIQQAHPRYPSPPMPSAEMNPYNSQGLDTAQEDAIENLPTLQNNEIDAPSPGRSKPIPKPNREVTKGDNGRFVCMWSGCNEEVKEFGRKCEWSKHMDKHDRPYKCPADGCEKLPGFTYSGGLLRHEREVHGKHGGPRKQLNCPHPNCKRHVGKGFSRQENLNEHLRRVHTSDGAIPDGAETEDEGSDTKAGIKRKRGPGRSSGDDIREELKRLRAENEELRRHSEAQTAQTAEMMNQIRQLQSVTAVAHPRMPNAPML